MAKLGRNCEARRAIGRAAAQICTDVGTSHGLISYGVVDESDVEVLLQDLDAAPVGAAKEKVALIIARIVCGSRLADPTLKDRALAAAKDDLALAAALKWVLARRAEMELQLSRNKSSAPDDRSAVPDPDPTLEDRIDSVDIKDPMAFAQICQPFFYSDWDLSAEILPGWQHLSAAAHARTVRAAESYLKATSVEDGWIEAQLIWSTVSYGYWALRLLSRVAPAVFIRLTDEVWEAWMPCVFGEHYRPEPPDDAQVVILKTAYSRCPSRFREVLVRFIDAQNRTREEIHILDRTTLIWDHEIAELLRTRLCEDGFSPHAFRRILAALISAGDEGAFRIAAEIVAGAIDATPDQIEKPIQAALEFVTQDPSAAWKVVWPVVQRSEEFAKRLFSYYAIDPHSSEATLFLDGLGEQQLAEWYIWLSRYVTSLGVNEGLEWEGLAPTGFALSGPTRGWYWLSTTVLNTLVMRGTAEALEAIRFIDKKEPDEKLKRVQYVAEELFRQKTRVPILPSDLIDLASIKPPVSFNGRNKEPIQGTTPRSTPRTPIRRFVGKGNTWSLCFDGISSSIPARVGVAYISHLLRCPDRYFGCMELQTAGHSKSSLTLEAQEAELSVADLTGDDILTPEARQRYRDRIDFIEAELHHADLNNDPAQRELLLKEKRAIAEEIRKASGLRGRHRKFATDAERARKAVSRAIRDAFKLIAKDQPRLAEHIRARIKLGGQCCYWGDGIDWEV